MKAIPLNKGVLVHFAQSGGYLITRDDEGNMHNWRVFAGDNGAIRIMHSSSVASSIAIHPLVSNHIELVPKDI